MRTEQRCFQTFKVCLFPMYLFLRRYWRMCFTKMGEKTKTKRMTCNIQGVRDLKQGRRNPRWCLCPTHGSNKSRWDSMTQESDMVSLSSPRSSAIIPSFNLRIESLGEPDPGFYLCLVYLNHMLVKFLLSPPEVLAYS